ncbi:MAG: HNH endonuclease [Elusimicrobiota bacterium]
MGKDRVWKRDCGCCAFTSLSGRRCTRREMLVYDHILPWARGGSSDDLENIRLLCRAHNLFRARRAFGNRVPRRRD